MLGIIFVMVKEISNGGAMAGAVSSKINVFSPVATGKHGDQDR